jgi:hypothetical protein
MKASGLLDSAARAAVYVHHMQGTKSAADIT